MSHRRNSTVLLALFLAIAGMTLGACNTFKIETPPQFVSLERVRTTRYYKAISTDGSVVTVSAFDHLDKGTLAYWTEIVRREMTLSKGYVHTGTTAVKTRRGLAGQQLAFTAQNAATTYAYTATVFVTKKRIYVIEAAAKAPDFAAHKAAFDAVITGFQPKRAGKPAEN
jgi:hypothetical protein